MEIGSFSGLRKFWAPFCDTAVASLHSSHWHLVAICVMLVMRGPLSSRPKRQGDTWGSRICLRANQETYLWDYSAGKRIVLFLGSCWISSSPAGSMNIKP